jgi:ribosomal protein L37E
MRRTKTIEVTEVLCDKCGKSSVETFMEQCVVCGSDICTSCGHNIIAPEGWVEATICTDCFTKIVKGVK